MVGGVLYTTRGIPSQRRRDRCAPPAKRCGSTGSTKGQRGDRAPRSVIARRRVLDRRQSRRASSWSRAAINWCRSTRRPGLPDPAFGKNGVVDLYRGFRSAAARRTASSARRRRPSSCRNVIVIGAAMVGGTAPRSKENTKGYIRGFDVRTGKRLWTFHTIPQPGEFGNDTWQNDSWSYTGNTDGVVAVLGRRRARLRVSACRIGDRRFLRRPPAGQQPVRRQPRLPRRAEPASASGISSSCITTSGTTTWRRRRR